MIQPDIFYRRFGVRTPPHLVSPLMPAWELFEFPRKAVWHYLSFDNIAVGPQSDEYILRNVSKKIMVEHVTHLTSAIGEPRVTGTSLENIVRDFHMRNKRFRRMMNIAEDLQDETILGIVSYALASHNAKYVRSFYKEYYSWYNIQKTAWDKIRAMTAIDNHQHYLVVGVPQVLPSIQRLQNASKKIDQSNLKFLDSHESMFLLEMWKWIDEDHRKDSMIGEMPQNQLDKINIVFQDGNRWIMMNLGVVNSWRYIKDAKNPDQKQAVKIVPFEMQKRMLRGLMTLMEQRTVTAVDDETAATPEVLKTDDETKTSTEDVTKHQEVEKILSTMDADLKQLEVAEAEAPAEEENTALAQAKAMVGGEVDITAFDNVVTPEQHIRNTCEKLLGDGLMSGRQFNAFTKHLENFQNLPSPDPEVKLKDFIVIPPEDIEIKEPTKINDIVTVPDKSMLESTLLNFDRKYINKIMHKDIASMIVATQKAGFVITNYEVEKREDALGAHEMHTVRISPVEGATSTLRFKLPAVSESGEYAVGGTRYRLNKQRGDLPIRQIAPNRVALTSYYGKTFVTRNEKKVNNYEMWLHDNVMAASLEDEPRITNLKIANAFDHQFAAPRGYSAMSNYFTALKVGRFNLNFDHKERVKLFGEDNIKKYERRGSVLLGLTDTDGILTMDSNNTVYEDVEGSLKPLGSLEQVLGLDASSAPVEYAEVKIYGKTIPVGIVLAYLYGFENLLALLKVKPRRVNAGQRLNLQEHEYAIVFSDETVILSREDRIATMVLAGFREYEKATKNYSVHTFDKKGVYVNVLENYNISARYIREIDLIDKMFVDPITEELLVKMKEPLTFRGLLVRSAELLLKDQHPHSLDHAYMREKGYERFSGAIYTEIVNACREHNSRVGKSNFPVELHPFAIWKRITSDPSVALVNDINPIQNIKEQEAVTFGGVGGRNSRSMTRNTREFHPSDMGVISEATKDSSDVGINTYTTANPNFDSVRGTTKRIDMKNLKMSSLFSTSALLSVGSDHDDPKRVNFVSIQQSHGVACNGYSASAVRTGYEQVLIHRVGEGYGKVADKDGEVIDRNDLCITVKYKDQTTENIPVGRRFGKAADLTIAHELASDYKVGQKFKQGDVLMYNSGFFERDQLNPKSVVWKSGVMVRVALLESRETHEDASSISKSLAEKLVTKTTKVKNIVVGFDQKVSNLVKVGDVVEHSTILCAIEDSTTAGSQMFDTDSLNTLRLLSSQTPQAKVKGVIERIEVFYHGDKEDMHPSLKTIANASDKELAERSRAQGKQAFNGSVDESFRVEGDSLMLDTLAIRVYITSDVPAGIGDKGVLANQMKSVISNVMEHDVTTESGEPIDVIFGAQSIFNRIVTSPFIIGTTTTLLGIVGKKAASIYRNEKP